MKVLTPGTWIFLANLCPTTTDDEELAAYFQQCGMAIPPEAISTRDFNEYRTALGSLSSNGAAVMGRGFVSVPDAWLNGRLITDQCETQGIATKTASRGLSLSAGDTDDGRHSPGVNQHSELASASSKELFR